jgi:hypothetical protein
LLLLLLLLSKGFLYRLGYGFCNIATTTNIIFVAKKVTAFCKRNNAAIGKHLVVVPIISV